MKRTSMQSLSHKADSRVKPRMGRFQVIGLDSDRELIQFLARRLAEKSSDETQIRAALRRTIANRPRSNGGILSALRRSPLVGADLDIKRAVTHSRKVDL